MDKPIAIRFDETLAVGQSVVVRYRAGKSFNGTVERVTPKTVTVEWSHPTHIETGRFMQLRGCWYLAGAILTRTH